MGLVFLVILSSFSMVDPTDWNSLDYMQQRGYGEGDENVRRALLDSFDKQDMILFNSVSLYLMSIEEFDKFAQLAIDRYHQLPDSTYKEELAVSLGIGVCSIPRFARSKYGCEFYRVAISRMFSGRGNFRLAGICVSYLSREKCLPLAPFAVKALLVADLISADTSDALNYMGERNLYDSLSPEEAYFIHMRLKEDKFYQERYSAHYKAKAKPYLDGALQAPDADLRKDLLSRLNDAIDDEGRKYCEKYGSAEPGPYEPHPPIYLENHPSRLNRDKR
jgi:hypothetical protein